MFTVQQLSGRPKAACVQATAHSANFGIKYVEKLGYHVPICSVAASQEGIMMFGRIPFHVVGHLFWFPHSLVDLAIFKIYLMTYAADEDILVQTRAAYLVNTLPPAVIWKFQAYNSPV